METNVFANNNEVVSKGADGKSIAFPDVCWTPPAPPAGPIPLPYPNSTEDKDLDNGTTTVQIKDKAVCMGDMSYIAKSKGDEGATQSQQKNLITSSIQGKGYFITSSQDVVVEGKGVTRHLDMMTHNHASPAGTPGGSEGNRAGGGGNTNPQQGKTKKIKEVEFLGIALIREKTVKDGNNIGTTYCFKSQGQIDKVSSNEDIIKYCQNKNTQVPDTGHCVLPSANNTELQIVNFNKSNPYNSIVTESGSSKYNVNVNRNNTRVPINSISMVGNEVSFVLFFSGENISKEITIKIERTLGQVYSQSEKQCTLYQYGFLENNSYTDTITRTISTNISIPFNVQLDLAQGANYVISAVDDKNIKLEAPLVVSYKKMYYTILYAPETPAYNAGVLNLCNSIETFYSGMNQYVDLECIEKTQINISEHTRNTEEYMKLRDTLMSSQRYSSLETCIPIFIFPDAFLRLSRQAPSQTPSQTPVKPQLVVQKEFDILIGSAKQSNHLGYIEKVSGELLDPSLNEDWAESLRVNSIRRLKGSERKAALANLATKPVMSAVSPNSFLSKNGNLRDLDLHGQFDFSSNKYNLFAFISQSSISSGLQIQNEKIKNNNVYRIGITMSINEYHTNHAAQLATLKGNFLLIGYHNIKYQNNYFWEYDSSPSNPVDIIQATTIKLFSYHEMGHLLGLVFCNRNRAATLCSGYPCSNRSGCQDNIEGSIRHIPEHSTYLDGHAKWYTKNGDLGPHCNDSCIMFGHTDANVPQNDFCRDCRILLMKAPCRKI